MWCNITFDHHVQRWSRRIFSKYSKYRINYPNHGASNENSKLAIKCVIWFWVDVFSLNVSWTLPTSSFWVQCLFLLSHFHKYMSSVAVSGIFVTQDMFTHQSYSLRAKRIGGILHYRVVELLQTPKTNMYHDSEIREFHCFNTVGCNSRPVVFIFVFFKFIFMEQPDASPSKNVKRTSVNRSIIIIVNDYSAFSSAKSLKIYICNNPNCH